MNSKRLAIIGGLFLSLLAAGSYWFRPVWEAEFWRWTSGWALNEAQQQRLGDCETMEWLGIARVLRQGVSDTCAIEWLPEQLEGRLNGFRTEWLKDIAANSALPNGTRLKTMLILEHVGQREPGLSEMVDRAEPALQDAVISWFVEGGRDTSWTDPLMGARVDVLRYADGHDDARAGVIRQLQWETLLHPLAVDQTRRENLLALASSDLGLLPEDLGPGRDLFRRGGAWPDMSIPSGCANPTGSTCLGWLAERMAAQDLTEWDGDNLPARPQNDLSESFLNAMIRVRYQETPQRSLLHASLWTEYREWIRSVPVSGREALIFYWFGSRTPPFGATGTKILDELEPVPRMMMGASSPWVFALALMELSDGEVEVTETSGVGRVRQGERILNLEACRLSLAVEPGDEKNVLSLSREQVAARAALEWASQLLVSGDHEQARRMLRLSLRFDQSLGEEAITRMEASDWADEKKSSPLADLVAGAPRRAMDGANPLASPETFSGCSTSLFWSD